MMVVPTPLSYSSPDGYREPVRPVFVFLGVAVALALGPGVSFGGMGLGTLLGSGNYAGLGGWIIGTIAAGVFSLFAFAFALFNIRSPSGRRRGLAVGMLIGVGLSLLTLGVCFGVAAL